MKINLLKFYLASGQVEKANKINSKYFFLEGRVIVGNQQSHLINFPSLNICHSAKNFILKIGCYLTLVWVRNKYYYGLTCLLKKSVSKIFSYTYLENFSQTVYQEKIKIYFLAFYRENVSFLNWEQIKKVIVKDLKYLKNKPKINWEKI